jgi:hypothetical protein
MKTGTLLQSFLLTAGLILGGIPTVQADYAYSGKPGSGKYHHFQNDRRSSGHTPWWSSSHHGKHNPERHWQNGKYDSRGDRHDRGNHWKHGKYDGRGDRHDHGDHWKHGKYDGRGHGRDRKDIWQHGRHDGRGDAGRKGQRSRSAGIGYTGRS